MEFPTSSSSDDRGCPNCALITPDVSGETFLGGWLASRLSVFTGARIRSVSPSWQLFRVWLQPTIECDKTSPTSIGPSRWLTVMNVIVAKARSPFNFRVLRKLPAEPPPDSPVVVVLSGKQTAILNECRELGGEGGGG
jgi:hypothetical protein